jgi:hypothetical protein
MNLQGAVRDSRQQPCDGSSDCGKKDCDSCKGCKGDEQCISCGGCCGELKCCFDKTPGKLPQEIACHLAPAVVGIQSQWIFTTSPGGTPPAELADRQDFIINGSGAIIDLNIKRGCDEGKVWILTTAGMVLAPPTVISQVNRYPFVSPSVPAPTSTNLINTMTAPSRILVTVSRVNKTNKTFVYEGKLEYVDGAGDMAIISISQCSSPFNRCNPEILKCHPRLCFGQSRRVKPGDPIYALGDYGTSPINPLNVSGYRMFTAGVVNENRYVDYSGWYQGELLLGDFTAHAPKVGMPILNKHGHIVAIQSISTIANLPRINNGNPPAPGPLNIAQGTGAMGGPSSKFIERFLRSVECEPCSSSLELINDPVGPYYRFTKPYFGLAWEAVTADTFTTTYNNVTGSRSIDIDPVTGQLNTTAQQQIWKQLQGVQIMGIAGDGGSSVVAPGLQLLPYVAGANGGLDGGPTPAGFPDVRAVYGPVPSQYANSPALGLLAVGDIIVKVGDNAVGSQADQISPGLVTWSMKPECCTPFNGNIFSKVPVQVITAASGWTQSACYYLSPITFPLYMDYPWYQVNNFPLVTPPIAPTLGLLTNPQIPNVAFKPAF